MSADLSVQQRRAVTDTLALLSNVAMSIQDGSLRSDAVIGQVEQYLNSAISQLNSATSYNRELFAQQELAANESREAGREYRDRHFIYAARSALNELVEKAQEEILNDLQDKIHLLSVGASFIPIAGTAVSIGLDALNVAISLARGNTDEAKLYTLFAIPIIGDIAGVGALLYVGGAYANRFYDYFFGTPDPELPPEFREIIYHIEWVSGGANNSFAAGTGVVTGIDEDGNYITTNIEDLEVGDVVLSSDEFNPDGTPKFTIVTDVRSTTVYEQTVVTYVDANGNVETLQTTAGHEFFVEGLGWITAGELVEGQELLLPDGSTVTVASVETEAIPEGLVVYNLTVSDGATYFVDDGQGNVSPVLVHNASFISQALKLINKSKVKSIRVVNKKGKLVDTPIRLLAGDHVLPREAVRQVLKRARITKGSKKYNQIVSILDGKGKNINLVPFLAVLNSSKGKLNATQFAKTPLGRNLPKSVISKIDKTQKNVAKEINAIINEGRKRQKDWFKEINFF